MSVLERIVEELPADVRAYVLVEVPDPADRPRLALGVDDLHLRAAADLRTGDGDRRPGVAHRLSARIAGLLESPTRAPMLAELSRPSASLTLPEGFLGTDAILVLATNIAAGLEVREDVIRRHVDEQMPFMATERWLMLGTAAGGDRQSLHEVVRRHSLAVAEAVSRGEANTLLDRLAADPAFRGVPAAALPRRRLGAPLWPIGAGVPAAGRAPARDRLRGPGTGTADRLARRANGVRLAVLGLGLNLRPKALLLAVAIGMLWWRGPDWDQVGAVFTVVEWRWIVGAVGRVNLFNGFADKARLAEARADISRRSLERDRRPVAARRVERLAVGAEDRLPDGA